jgi:hypothetical protein
MTNIGRALPLGLGHLEFRSLGIFLTNDNIDDGLMYTLYAYIGALKYYVCQSYAFPVHFVHKVAILMGQ